MSNERPTPMKWSDRDALRTIVRDRIIVDGGGSLPASVTTRILDALQEAITATLSAPQSLEARYREALTDIARTECFCPEFDDGPCPRCIAFNAIGPASDVDATPVPPKETT